MIEKYYGPFLDKVLHTRYITIAIAVAVLLVTIAYVKSGRMGMSMFPKIESDYAQASVTLPYGAPIENTEKIARRIMAAADEIIAENGGDQLALARSASLAVTAVTKRGFVFISPMRRCGPSPQMLSLNCGVSVAASLSVWNRSAFPPIPAAPVPVPH